MIKPKTKNQKPKTKGQMMLLTILTLGGAMLGASTIAGYLMILKVRTSSDITNSVKAIFAAETGIEWELYKLYKQSGNLGSFLYPKPKMTNNSDFKSFYNKDTGIISIGEAGNSHRAFQMEQGE